MAKKNFFEFYIIIVIGGFLIHTMKVTNVSTPDYKCRQTFQGINFNNIPPSLKLKLLQNDEFRLLCVKHDVFVKAEQPFAMMFSSHFWKMPTPDTVCAFKFGIKNFDNTGKTIKAFEKFDYYDTFYQTEQYCAPLKNLVDSFLGKKKLVKVFNNNFENTPLEASDFKEIIYVNNLNGNPAYFLTADIRRPCSLQALIDSKRYEYNLQKRNK